MELFFWISGMLVSNHQSELLFIETSPTHYSSYSIFYCNELWEMIKNNKIKRLRYYCSYDLQSGILEDSPTISKAKVLNIQ
jgi:hypothetical protein